MQVEIWLPMLERVLGECGVHSVPKIFERGYRVKVEATELEKAIAVWSRMVYELAKEGLINGACSCPFISLDGACVLWINDQMVVIQVKEVKVSTNLKRPKISEPLTIAIGGGSCSGKTSIANRLKKQIAGKVYTYPAFTNRPKRPLEVEGVDYFFRNEDDLAMARLNPRFSGFVEARGYWYWIDASRLLSNIWKNPDGIHLFFISQPHDYLRRKTLFPNLKWIWLDIPEEELHRRLLLNPDRDLQSSLKYNKLLLSQDRSSLVDLSITNEIGRFDEAAKKVRDYVRTLVQERSKPCVLS